MNMNQANQFFISYYQSKEFNVYRIFLPSFYIFNTFAISSIMKQNLYLGGQNMLSINQLIKYLRNHHHITVKSNQAQSLRNIGYYHGYKGYRFIRTPNQRIPFSSLDEVIALNKFDMQLKTIIYPKVMFIENALKSYVIEAILHDCHSENLDTIFNKSITDYKSYTPGSQQYHKQYAKRMTLKGKINNALLRDYSNKKQTVDHFFNADQPIPIWAVFESLTLGEFGTFFACSNSNVKLKTSSILHLPSNRDTDGKITEFIIYAIKDLRNAVAHNNTIFDTRFQTSTINNRLVFLLETEVGITGLDFKSIYAYIVLITYVLLKMGETKTSCKHFITEFIDCTDSLRKQISPNICNQILGTQQRAHLRQLQNFISQS